MADGLGSPEWVLGLDIGSASIGWALVDRAGQRLEAAGSRIFPAGVDDAKFARGESGASNNTERRRYRLQRRQFRRRAARQRSLFVLLQRTGLLPGPYDPSEPAERAGSPDRRRSVLDALDRALAEKWRSSPELATLAAPAQVLPYFLRAHSLDHGLEAHELGRILYHLAQRRGFRSNRREARSERDTKRQAGEDERSRVKSDIGTLKGEIGAAGARTLGEYFSRLDPRQVKIRRRFAARAMYSEEFEAIWAAQAGSHSLLTPALRQKVEHLLFFQRPVGAGTPGRCELEPSQTRAPMASLPAQRFRLLQKLNDLRVVSPDDQERTLDPDERTALLAALEAEGSLKFSEIKKRKLVHVPKGHHFNLERGGEKTMPGNNTAASLRRIFGASWGSMPTARRDQVVTAWIETEDDAEFERLGRERYGLSLEAMDAWCNLDLADGYARLSLQALQKLLPPMELGVPFKTAEKDIYGDPATVPVDTLPPVAQVLPALANPAVMRSLSELRQLVNALVREYGKPYEIRIELARDLKRNAKQREQMSRTMRDREAGRKKAAARVVEEAGIASPKGGEIEKALLFEQCGGQCPYCGRGFSFRDAFEAERVEVDHILPRSRFPDDSLGNKVLSHRACNQQKLGRTPYEAFGGDDELWDQILQRVRGWGDEGKLRAFQITNADDLDPAHEGGFADRRLNDTRYASKLAARYLGSLYGGRDVGRADGSRRRVVFATTGVTTTALRRGWQLDAILARVNGQGKNRLDHRHHAVDALVIALSSNAAIQQMSAAAAADSSGRGRISSRSLEAPWPDFVDSVRPAIESINVSHRPNHRLRGGLHNDTIYSRPHTGPKARVSHLRCPVHSLSKKEGWRDIVDSRVREAVRQKIEDVGGDPKKLENNWPVVQTRGGDLVPIRKVRVADRPSEGLATVGEGPRERIVSESANHHVALFAGTDARGRERWARVVVSRLEAANRQARCQHRARQHCDCVVSRQWNGDGQFEFLFSLMGCDLVEMGDGEGGQRRVYVVRTISEAASGQLELAFVALDRAGMVKDLRKEGQWIRIKSLDDLRRRGCVKVSLDVLGRLRQAGD